MNTIFMNSRNSKTSNPHKPFVNLANKIKKDKYIVLSKVSIYYTWKKY